MKDIVNFLRHKASVKVFFVVIFFVSGFLGGACVKEELNSIEEMKGRKITEKDKNPYSKEETVGFYMFDIFEAYRGCCIVEECFEKDGLSYYEIFSPYQDGNYNMEWSIGLTRMKEDTLLSKEFNRFHETLFEDKVNEMEQLSQEGRTRFQEDGFVDFSYYSRNICTEVCYFWGSVFTVIDIENIHMPMIGGVSIIAANFNEETGKKYELVDLYTESGYKEWILAEIKRKYPEEEYIVQRWKESWDYGHLVFLMAKKGLVIVDNFNQEVELIEWECMEDILNQEVKEMIWKESGE